MRPNPRSLRLALAAAAISLAATGLAPRAGAPVAGAAAPGTKTVNVLLTDDVFDANPNVPTWGRVTSSPAGINCPGDCTEDFPRGSTVTMTFAPTPGYKLARWGVFESAEGAGCATAARSCTLTVADDDRVAQVEAALRPEAQLFATPEGAGTLTISPVEAGRGVAPCTVTAPLFDRLPDVCAPRYRNGTRVTVTALPDRAVAGARFDHWSDYRCGRKPSCTVKLGGDRYLSAFFSPVYLTVSAGSFGAVTLPAPGGLCMLAPDPVTGDTALPCQFLYPLGRPVTLTRDPAAAQVPTDEWTGSCTGAGPACTLTMSKNEYVRAGTERTLDVPTRVGVSITLEYAGRSGGSITLQPKSGSGRSATCKSTCVRTGYQRDDRALLTAKGSKRTKFVRWSDGYNGTSRTRLIKLGESNPVRAVFGRK